MRITNPFVTLALLFPLGVSAQGWMGADAEKDYDRKLAALRAAGELNNDDYYEIHRDGRIYVFTDLMDYKLWQEIHEIPLVVTKIAAGPNGETVLLQLTKKDGKAMEKTVGYKGPTEKMWTGETQGIEKGFYGEVVKDNRYYVFSDWKDLHGFRESGEVPCGITNIGAGPEGRTVVFVQNCKAAARGRPDDAMARFKANYGLK